MLVILVYVHVKPEYIEEFKTLTLENARESLKEAGIVRFDVIQQEDDPTKFILIEVYKNSEATAAHKQTPHYAKWRENVEHMMVEPRKSVRYIASFLR